MSKKRRTNGTKHWSKAREVEWTMAASKLCCLFSQQRLRGLEFIFFLMTSFKCGDTRPARATALFKLLCVEEAQCSQNGLVSTKVHDI